MSKLTSRIAFFGLALALGSLPASAARIEVFTSELGRAVWWVLSGGGAPAAPKHGCSIDPDGNTVCAPKHGCTIDPNGSPSCAPLAPKAGCGISPDGTPRCTP